ncbi:MAG: phospho-N-acetylmuramoyl-pentapeptide-transferase [Clostridia bacterium]|nr:phospho-N-acetylmuramoyl-pentapeptide-transferase [Clostridia bacterium]
MIASLICLVSALVLMLLFMPSLLKKLRALKFGQTIYDLGPKAHLNKQGTPNMGGLLIGGITLLAAVVTLLIYWGKQGGSFIGMPLLFIVVLSAGAMAIGFADDYIKDVKKDHEGLKPRQKIIGQVILGLAVSIMRYAVKGGGIRIPFTSAVWDLGLFYIPVMTVLVMFITNSSNLQDGVDGLLSTVTVMSMLGFAAIYLFRDTANACLAPVAAALCGACLGFLHFNRHPARIFMGDTGSMFIGGVMTALAMWSGHEIFLIFLSFTCIISSLSVMLQVSYFKLTHGKRIFKMSPLHHHFELCGFSENKIDLMYGAVSLLMALIAFLAA